MIPPEAVPHLADGIDRLLASERMVLGAAESPDFDFARLQAAWAAFERARV